MESSHTTTSRDLDARGTPGMPRIVLGSWPTPLEPAPRLAEAIGLNPGDLWVKRDDLSGLGGGGNKIRKLEWTVAAAVAAGADTLVTTGAPQSNHAMLTAAAAARLGLDAVLVFPGEPGDSTSGNLALDGLFGARIAWAGDSNDGPAQLEQTVNEVVERLRADGAHPSVIPFGGSNGVGAQGYVLAARELLTQAPALEHVVVAVGSGATMAGLVTAGRRQRDDPVGTRRRHRARPHLHRAGIGRLTAAIADGHIKPGQSTVFMHTGGLPGLFGHPDAVRFGESGTRRFPLP